MQVGQKETRINPRGVYWMSLIGVATLLMFQLPSAAAESANCTVTRLSNGAFRYQLSELPSSTSCSTCWEDTRRTVLARDSAFNENLVENLTEDHIDLKACQDHLRHTRECSQVGGETEEHIDCKVNCSSFQIQEGHPENRICFSKDRCMDVLPGVLIICVPVVLVVLGLIVCIYRKRKSSYSPPTEQNQMEMNSNSTKTQQ